MTIPINKPRKIIGAFTWPRLYQDMIDRFPSGSIFIEVGVFHGMSMYFLLNNIREAKKNIMVYGVDHFCNQSEGLIDEVNQNLSPFGNRYKLIARSSKEASFEFASRSIDFVFIDAGHYYEDIITDIRSWLPKIKDGGVIAGHDYVSGYSGVVSAVDEIFGDRVCKDYINENSWLVNL